jgi:Tol biopolymer transport system component
VRDITGGVTNWATAGARGVLKSVFGTANGVCCGHRLSADGSLVACEISVAAYAKTAGAVIRCHVFTGQVDVVNTNADAPVGTYEDLRPLDMTPDGRFIASVGNMDSAGLNTAIYLWDSLSGTNILVSASTNGVAASGIYYDPIVDGAGRYVVFLGNNNVFTTNPVAPGSWHLYSRDTVANTTVMADINSTGAGMGVNPEGFPNLSGDGTLLAFESEGSGDRNHFMDVYLADLTSNATENVSAASPAVFPMSADGPSLLSLTFPISTNGQYIVFTSDADDLVGGDVNGYRDVFERNVNSGGNILVSADTNGLPAAGVSADASVSADGRYVAFSSSAANLVPGDANNLPDVFVRDMQTGTTTLVSVITGGQSSGNGASVSPVISGDGRFVLFRSLAQNLAAGSFGSGITNLFLRDRQAGKTYALTAATSGTGVSAAAMTPNGYSIAFIGIPAGSSSAALYIWSSLAATRIYINPVAYPLGVAISSNGKRVAYSTSTSLAVADLELIRK